MLDAVMLKVKGKRGKPGARNKAETPQAKPFPLKNQTSLPLVRSLLPKILPLVGTYTHQV